MTLDDLKQILEMVREHELAEFEFEQEGVKLRLKKYGTAPPVFVPAPVPAAALAVAPAQAPSALAGAAAAAADAAADEVGVDLQLITSPIVGTFYRASSPEAPAFVELGTRVKTGQALCIIEAMKLMNEIESECDGEVVRIFVENGQPVQYGERLFAIKR